MQIDLITCLWSTESQGAFGRSGKVHHVRLGIRALQVTGGQAGNEISRSLQTSVEML